MPPYARALAPLHPLCPRAEDAGIRRRWRRRHRTEYRHEFDKVCGDDDDVDGVGDCGDDDLPPALRAPAPRDSEGVNEYDHEFLTEHARLRGSRAHAPPAHPPVI